MSLNSHIQELQRKHQTLSAQVEAVEHAPGADHLKVAALKKEKLRLKEEISRLSS